MWQIKRNGVVIAWGSAETKPTPDECRMFRADGYKVYLDGKEVKK